MALDIVTRGAYLIQVSLFVCVYLVPSVYTSGSNNHFIIHSQYDPAPVAVRHRQPSIADDSSSSEEDTLKANDAQQIRKKEQHR